MDTKKYSDLVMQAKMGRQSKDNKFSWNKIVVPILFVVIILLFLTMVLMNIEVVGLEYALISLLLFIIFILIGILILTGKLGLKLALVRIPPLRKFVGDQFNVKLTNSGRTMLDIGKYESMQVFDEKEPVITKPATMYEAETTLPLRLYVQGFPFSIDPRDSFNLKELGFGAEMSRLIGTGFVEFYHKGRQEGFNAIDQIMKWLKYVMIAIAVVAILTGFVAYTLNDYSEVFSKISIEYLPKIDEAVSLFDEYKNLAIQQVASEGNANYSPT